jgi:FkbM family methyltransferase
MGRGARVLAGDRPLPGHLAKGVRERLKAVTRSIGLEIRRIDSHFQKRPIDFIRSRAIDVVVDVGANTGQYAARLREDGYAGWIVSAEPVSAAFQAVSACAGGDSRWKTMNLAFGEKDGSAEINVSEASVLSSFQRQLPAALAFNSEARVVGCETVRMMRLDDVFPELPRGRAFLKIDTQGYERQVLAGASECLSQFLGVQMEIPIVHLYHGTWNFHEAVAYMYERAFEISNIIPVNYDHADAVSLLEVDCIFRARQR